MLKRRQLQNIYSDKSSLILRAMLKDPKRKWKIPDFQKIGVSFGLTNLVLNRAESLGFVNRVRIGPGSYSVLSNKREELLNDWINNYSFSKNLHTYYYSHDKNILKECKKYFEEKNIEYSLTLYSASRLISPYVKDERSFIYVGIKPEEAEQFLNNIVSRYDLKKLIKGGNLCFAIPFYGSSVFKESRKVKGFNLVSNLQLYLDLVGFPPTGIEEALQLKEYWQKAGEEIA